MSQSIYLNFGRLLNKNAMCATSSIPDTSVDIAINNGVNVSVLNIGVQFTYRIPSFSVIEVELRQGTFQFEHLDGSVRVYDGFLRSDQNFPDPSRPSTTPFAITIKDHCFVDVSCFPILLYWRILKYCILLLQV